MNIMNAAVYSVVTGEIRAVQILECNIAIKEEENIIFGKDIGIDSYVDLDSGSVKRYSDEEMRAKQSPPYGYMFAMPARKLLQVMSDSEISDHKASTLRSKRDDALRVVDSISPVRWANMPEVERTAWGVYRQALLDVPQQPGFPDTVEWPVSP